MSSAQSLEVQARIAVLRQRCIDNTATLDEMREAVRLMRGDRQHAAAASDSARRAKAKAAIPSAADMLGELGGL